MKKMLVMKSFSSKKIVEESILSALKRTYPKASTISLRGLRVVKTAMGWKSVVIRASAIVKTRRAKKNIRIFGGWDTQDPFSKKRAFYVLEYLWNSGFNRTPLLVPRPLVFDAKQSLLLYIEYPGKVLFELFWKKRVKHPNILFLLIGKWLANLHALPPQSFIPKIKPVDDQAQYNRNIHTFRNKGCAFFASNNPEGAIKLSKELMLKREHIQGHQKRFSVVHGDFHFRNCLTNNAQNEIGIIDFNETRLHDPMDDIAYVLVRTDIDLARFLAPTVIHRLQRCILRAYQHKRKKLITSAEIDRLRTHAAWTSLKLLQYGLETTPPFPHRHNPKKLFCRIENRFWQIALNPDKFLKPLL